jgi:hypothetical protein
MVTPSETWTVASSGYTPESTRITMPSAAAARAFESEWVAV